ncbi:hypothetical protein [Mycobacteroides abscessus]|uniref:hypothetical protein n=1 Tax=Mycobacteroides abscessus TaxID=36809 RepID=UPI000C269BAD|nr:hypothetical protein [Mycobacteroides abscessus]
MIIHTHDVLINGDQVHLSVAFWDEETSEILLEAETIIIGDERAALSYLPIFVRDLERNFPQIKNPDPEPEVPPMEEEMI